MARVNSPRGFLFIAGMDTVPLLMTFVKQDRYGNHYYRPSSYQKGCSNLRSRNKEQLDSLIDLSKLHALFANYDDEPFAEMWKADGDSLHKYFSDNRTNSVCTNKKDVCHRLSHPKDYNDAKLQSRFGYEETASKEIKFFVMKDLAAAIQR